MKPSSTLNTFSLFILLNPTEPYLLLTLEAHLGKIFHCALVVNSWEMASNVKAPDLVAKYYQKYPAAPRHICWTDFDTLFKSGNIASRHSNLEGGINIRGPLTRDSGAHTSPPE